MRRFLILLAALAWCLPSFKANAQGSVKDSTIFSPNFSFHFGWQWPSGDMEERFGSNGVAGASFNIKDRRNFIYGIDFSYMFGTEVKEPGLLQNLYTDNGEILDNEGQVAPVFIQQRGYNLMLSVGKIFPWFGPNPNSGVMLKTGIGFMQHKIRIEHQENFINPLEGDYIKGYDRLTNGLAFSQFLGYYYMSNSRLANFYLGVEFIQGLTQGRRDFNFDTRTVDDEKRLDLLNGVKFGWIVPLYKRQPEEFYIY